MQFIYLFEILEEKRQKYMNVMIPRVLHMNSVEKAYSWIENQIVLLYMQVADF